MDMGSRVHPGDSATAEQIFLLAEEYAAAARALFGLGRKGQPLSRAPYRLAAIHAIELYLDADLIKQGLRVWRIRAFNHDLIARARVSSAFGLVLREGTLAHLDTLSREREYLVCRYGTDQTALSPLTRLRATLDDISFQVGARLKDVAG